MARVHRVGTSRKEHTCGRGGHPIPKGDGYYHASPGFRGRKLIRCFGHPFRQSELTTSLRSEPLAALEAFEDAMDAIEATDETALDELDAAVEEFKSEVESYRDQRQDALDQWEYGNDQLQELLDTAENAASEAEGIVIESGTKDSFDTEDEWVEHVEAQIEEARSVAQSIEF